MTVPINQKSIEMEISINDTTHLHGFVVNGSYRENNREGGLGPGDDRITMSLSSMDELPFLGRESSGDAEFLLGREISGNSIKLGGDSSFDIGLVQIMVSADVHGFFLDETAEDYQQFPLDAGNFEGEDFVKSIVKFECPPITGSISAETAIPPSAVPETQVTSTENDDIDVDPGEYPTEAEPGESFDENVFSSDMLGGSKRGAHVKDRPDMQKTARDGAVHWANKLKLVKALWAARATSNKAFQDEFQGQIDLSFGRIRSKQECLLRTLQLAASEGIIKPGPFGAGGFFGWTKFDVSPERSREFRRRIEGLFPSSFKEDTLKETFRRSGLVPERWQWHLGWTGRTSWVYHARTRPSGRPE